MGEGVDLRARLGAFPGHATLIRAEATVRASVDVFQPVEQSLADLSRGIKTVMDPGQILNPGRMYAGF